MERCMLNLRYQDIIRHVGTICAWQMIYQLAFLWKTCGFIKGASVHLSGTKRPCDFQLWVSLCWCLPIRVWSHTKHKHMKKTFKPVLERHLMNAPLRFTWALRQGTWLSLRDLSVWFKPIIFFKLLSVTFPWFRNYQAHNIKDINCIPSWVKKL